MTHTQARKTGILLLLLVFILFGCSLEPVRKQELQQPSLSSYKHSYIGDAGAVSQIIGFGLGTAYGQGIELKTSEEPYGLIMNIGLHQSSPESEQDYQTYWGRAAAPHTALSNAMLFLSMVDNAGWVTFRLQEAEQDQMRDITIEREPIERIIGMSLVQLPEDENEIWKEIIRLLQLHRTAFDSYLASLEQQGEKDVSP